MRWRQVRTPHTFEHVCKLDKIKITLSRDDHTSSLARVKHAPSRQRRALASKPECPTINQRQQRTRSPKERDHDTNKSSTSKKHKSDRLTHFFAEQLLLLQFRLNQFHKSRVSHSAVTPYRLGDKDILHRWRPFILEVQAEQPCDERGETLR